METNTFFVRILVKKEGDAWFDGGFGCVLSRRRLARAHRPWLEAVIAACEFSRFLETTVSTKKAPTNPPFNGAKGKQDWTAEKEKRCQTRFASVEISDQVVVCRPGLPGSGRNSDPSTKWRGCSILAGAESGPQPQYPLQLRAFMQSQHDMSVGAAWRLEKLEQSASGENTRLIHDVILPKVVMSASSNSNPTCLTDADLV